MILIHGCSAFVRQPAGLPKARSSKVNKDFRHSPTPNALTRYYIKGGQIIPVGHIDWTFDTSLLQLCNQSVRVGLQVTFLFTQSSFREGWINDPAESCVSVLRLCHQTLPAPNAGRGDTSAVQSFHELWVALRVYLLPCSRCCVREFVMRYTYDRPVFVVKFSKAPANPPMHIYPVPGQS